MNTATVAGIRRRFLVLVGARWLGPGFLAPLLVLVLRDRGFSLAEIGMFFAIYGITTAVLELPTGGLADALGRRNVLAASAVLQLVLYAMLLTVSST
ncbi:MAG: MFS transporter, partial [Actinomycetota bacterium]|nr:MFS transporter [Actinomycetota bacterium]